MRQRSIWVACLAFPMAMMALSRLPGAEPTTLPRVPATEPKDVAAKFHTRSGFTLDLIAAEPLTTDPVAMAYDENGRAWVVEMTDYPYTDKANDVAWQDSTKDLPIGKVRILEDTDGDGVFDKSTIFARDLSWPTGIALFKGGAYIAATPDIWYLKDTNGDLKADVREKVFTGFRKYNVQAVMNNLAWGLDNKIYGAGSSNGGTIQSVGKDGVKPVTLSRNDYLIDPNTREFEAISGGARFGNAFDDWGNRFICNIRNPIQHVLLPSRYLKRNPYLVAPAAVQDVAEAGDTLPVYRTSPPEPWRTLRAERYLADSTSKVPRSETNQGYFTSSSGVTVYRGHAYPPEFRNNVFVGEVAGNLIHRQALEANGVTFKSHRTEENAEFATSDDNWFRPVNFVNAPDGTLHVLDMYRETIEHPWSIPDDIKAMVDLESGRDRGRIYRLSPPGFRVPGPPKLGKAKTVYLVGLLNHDNAWHRETAHRLLFERQDPAAVKPLKALARTGTPLGRLHALWSLEGLKQLDDADVLATLDDSSAGVREHAIRLAESRLSSPKVLQKVVSLTDDPETRVRFQLAFSLGETDSPAASEALVKLIGHDAADPWMRVAILSSLAKGADAVLARLVSAPTLDPAPPQRAIRRQLAVCVGARKDPAEVGRVLTALAKAASADNRPVLLSALAGLNEGLKRSRSDLRTAATSAGPESAALVSDMLKQAAEIASQDAAAEDVRIEAIELIGGDSFENARDVLIGLLAPRYSTNLQRAAVKTLAAYPNPEVTPALLNQWRTLTPSLRTEVVEQLLARADRTTAVLDAVEAGVIPPAQISPARQTLLLKHKDATIAARATNLLATQAVGKRSDVIASYQPALSLAGDVGRGRILFEKECALCHKSGDKGFDVGPNLATIRHRTPGEVMTQILDPNREVGPNFVNYVISIDDGRVTTGIIDSETATSVVLKRAEGVTETLLRGNIEAMSNSGQSLMPEGLEKKLSPQDMADLLAFLLGR